MFSIIKCSIIIEHSTIMNINVFRYHVKIAKPMNQPEIEQHILNAAIGAIHREAGLALRHCRFSGSKR